VKAPRSLRDDVGTSRRQQQFSEHAHRLIPGGAHTYSRGDDQFPAIAPRALSRGKGGRVWDIDGNEFVDWGMGINNVLVGHAEESIDDAAILAMRDGQAFSRPSPVEIEAAEAVLSLFPGMEMIKFAKNGSDANDAAIRLARAITGRELIAYDGTAPFLSIDDWFIGTTVVSAGVPHRIAELAVPFQFNDVQSVERVFAEHGDQIAAVVLEVCRDIRPAPGFLEAIRRLCDRHGTLLVFDEIVTAFRYSLHGAHSLFGVRPDLMTVGKGMANGYAVAALVGRREFMERGGLHHADDRVFLLSTTNGPERSGLAAALATVRFYSENDVIERLYEVGAAARSAAAHAAQRHGIADHVTATGDFDCRPMLVVRGPDGQPSLEYRTLLQQELIRAGVLMPWICPTFRHSEIDIATTREAFDLACSVLARALERGTTSGLLIGAPTRPVFRVRN
jgi:glutamate-1-semialdehyde 2,1-aminomutase